MVNSHANVQFPACKGGSLPAGGQTEIPALEAVGISKAYAGTLALNNVGLSVAPGEVHGLIGKNGAGKSTLMKVLSGAIPFSAGRIAVHGETVGKLDPIRARQVGIGIVHQNAELHLNLSVAANLFLGQEKRNRFRMVDDRAMRTGAEEALGNLGLSLPPDCLLADLDIADRQLVAIAKAVQGNASVLLLDEPTAALNKSQTEFLFRLVRSLSSAGMSTVYISHHLDEVIEITDRITVMRNGQISDVVDSTATNKDNLVDLMVGRRLEEFAPKVKRPEKFDVGLSLKRVSVTSKLDDVSLEIGKGEIVGLISRTGGGAGALSEVVGGVLPVNSGEISLVNKQIRPRTIRQAVSSGFMFVPEDMRDRGLVMQMSSAGNMTLARMGALTRRTLFDPRKENSEARSVGQTLNLVPADPSREAGTLSGGNQRKLLIGRALLAQAKVLALEEPTQGVDIEARRQIHDQLREMAAQGAVVAFSSTDPEELLELADRVVLLANGQIVADLPPAALTVESLLLAVQTDGKSLKETSLD